MRWDWLIAGGYNAAANQNSEAGADACIWRKLLAAPDTVRQRVTPAQSEIVVAAVSGFVGSGWKAFSAAAFLDPTKRPNKGVRSAIATQARPHAI